MLIKILGNSNGSYDWFLWDGPDGIDEYKGTEQSLGEAFEKIVYYRTITALDYLPDFNQKM